tara:strand:- start:182 stop:391 length:210 start_codon:yes stop_codon:yes gene_type:complete
MKVGDLVRLIDTFTTVDFVNMPNEKIVMIIEGPNEVGNIKVLLPNAKTKWVHCSDVEYYTRNTRSYLKE